jgi:pimeloyl-ACP methyl ester carboxylesterase
MSAAFREAERVLFEKKGLALRASELHPKSGPMIRALEMGEGDPVLFVHGGGSNAAGWTPLLAGWGTGRTIAIDRPGHGLSGRFSYRGVDLRRHAVEVLEGVIDALGLAQVDLVGNSMGGLWSFWLAIDRPARVRRIVQIGCPALILDTSAPLPLRLMSQTWLAKLMTRMEPPSRKNIRKLFARLGHPSLQIDDETLDLVMAGGKLPFYQEAWFSLIANVLSLGGKRISLPAEELRRVSQPTLFLWGAKDPFGSVEVGRKACAIMPDASLEVVGEGHLPWLDDPARCRELAERFLRAATSRPSAGAAQSSPHGAA